MRRPVSRTDAVRSPVIDVLEAQIDNRRPAMKEVSAEAGQDFSQQKLTIGLDLGDQKGGT